MLSFICILKVTQLTDKLKNQLESNKQAQDNLHEQVQEQKTLVRSAQDLAHTLETTVNELTTHLADSKEKVSQLDAQVSLGKTSQNLKPISCSGRDNNIYCVSAPSQLKAKTEMLLSAEAAKTAQKANLENSLESSQHALQDKQQVSALTLPVPFVHQNSTGSSAWTQPAFCPACSLSV